MPTTQELKQVEQRILRIQKCYQLGKDVLEKCPPYSPSEGLLKFAARHRITREQATKFRAMAMTNTGYTKKELEASFKAFRNKGRALTINHFVRLLSVPK